MLSSEQAKAGEPAWPIPRGAPWTRLAWNAHHAALSGTGAPGPSPQGNVRPRPRNPKGERAETPAAAAAVH
eukprot:15465773-Alexandrium_andersonii.AAC.1